MADAGGDGLRGVKKKIYKKKKASSDSECRLVFRLIPVFFS